MNKRRLLKLADLLEADAKNKKGIKFDLCTVGVSDTEGQLNCGTSACAMGLAAISGAFKRSAGLSFRMTGYSIDTTINGRVRKFDEAAKKVFEITYGEAFFLFFPLAYPGDKLHGARGERYVAKRIRDFVAGKVSPT